MTNQLQRQININIQLRRQLEIFRRDTVEFCAKFCEDHAITDTMGGIEMKPSHRPHHGHHYAAALREIIGIHKETGDHAIV